MAWTEKERNYFSRRSAGETNQSRVRREASCSLWEEEVMGESQVVTNASKSLLLKIRSNQILAAAP
jgi:hypothetical protein